MRLVLMANSEILRLKGELAFLRVMKDMIEGKPSRSIIGNYPKIVGSITLEEELIKIDIVRLQRLIKIRLYTLFGNKQYAEVERIGQTNVLARGIPVETCPLTHFTAKEVKQGYVDLTQVILEGNIVKKYIPVRFDLNSGEILTIQEYEQDL